MGTGTGTDFVRSLYFNRRCLTLMLCLLRIGELYLNHGKNNKDNLQGRNGMHIIDETGQYFQKRLAVKNYSLLILHVCSHRKNKRFVKLDITKKRTRNKRLYTKEKSFGSVWLLNKFAVNVFLRQQ